MRLPLIAELDSRDGTANKDSRLTNALSETDEGNAVAVVRPGMKLLAITIGDGHGLVAFNDELLSVYGANLLEVVYNPFDTTVTTSPIAGLYSCVWDGTRFLATQFFSSPRRIYESLDGLSWAYLADAPVMNSGSILTYSNGTYLIVDTVGAAYATRISTSTDGVVWNTRNIVHDFQYQHTPRSATCFVDTFVIVDASGFILTSTDACVTWTKTSVSTNLVSVVHDGDHFYVVGSVVWATSSDGVVWSESFRGAESWDWSWGKILSGGGYLFAIDTSGTMQSWTSIDGVIWEMHEFPFSPGAIYAADYTSDLFIVSTLNGVFGYNVNRGWSLLASPLILYASLCASPYSDLVAFSNTDTDEGAYILVDETSTRPVVSLTDNFFDFAQSTI